MPGGTTAGRRSVLRPVLTPAPYKRVTNLTGHLGRMLTREARAFSGFERLGIDDPWDTFINAANMSRARDLHAIGRVAAARSGARNGRVARAGGRCRWYARVPQSADLFRGHVPRSLRARGANASLEARRHGRPARLVNGHAGPMPVLRPRHAHGFGLRWGAVYQG